MAPSPLLHELLLRFKNYDVRAPRTAPPPSQDSCIICYRTFDRVDDPNDPNELPCRALQYPCGHYIGSSCFVKLKRSRSPMVCALCRRDIPIKKTISTRLATLAGLWIFRVQTQTARHMAMLRGDERDFNALTQSFVDGTMNALQALKLWWIYMQVQMVTFVCIFLPLASVDLIEAWFLCRYFGLCSQVTAQVYAAVLDFEISVVLLVTLAVFWNDLSRGGVVERGLVGLSFLFGVKGLVMLGVLGPLLFFSLVGLSVTTYGMLMAGLLVCGMKQARRTDRAD